MIVAAIVVLAVLGGGSYYGYTKWFANKAAPAPAAAVRPQPLPAVRVPHGGEQPAPPPPVKPQPAHKSAAPTASLAKQSGKSSETSAASVSKSQAPPAAVPAVPSGASSSQDLGIPYVRVAVLIRQVPPVYPPLAKQARVSGVVRLKVIIGKDGAVQEVTAISGHPFLRQAAIDAVRQWIYKPTLLNGEPTEVSTEVAVNFTLSGS
jgi:protein TonB